MISRMTCAHCIVNLSETKEHGIGVILSAAKDLPDDIMKKPKQPRIHTGCGAA